MLERLFLLNKMMLSVPPDFTVHRNLITDPNSNVSRIMSILAVTTLSDVNNQNQKLG